MTVNNLLAPYRVLDLTDENGWLTGKILGDLGADVIKIEPPGGDAGRARGPFYRGESLAWHAHNASKRGITLDLENETGRADFRRLAAKADFILESFAPEYLHTRGIGFAELREKNARLILTSITPFGQTGPYANYRGADLIAMAMSGFMSLVGEPGETPLRVSLPQAAQWTGMYAAAGALIAHYHCENTGRGQHVDVSMQAGMLWALANAPAFWSLNRESLTRGGSFLVGRNVNGAKVRAIYPCREGYINFALYGGDSGKRSHQGFIAWMNETDAAPGWLKQKDWNAFNVARCTQADVDAIEKPFADFLRARTKTEFVDAAVRHEIIGYPVADARDLLTDAHLQARDFWQTVEHPELGALKYAGAFAKFSRSEIKIRRPAPRIGEHNAEILVEG